MRSIVMCYLGVVILLAALQRSLIYAPSKYVPQFADSGLPRDRVRDITLTSTDGIQLHGWLTNANVTVKSSRLVIVFPGNAGNRSYRGDMLASFNELGWDALICDYRGYADNSGSPSEHGFSQDALAVWKFATEELRYQPRHIVLCGESLGGGVATRLASEVQATGKDCGGLILRTTFTSLLDLARERFPWAPVGLILLDQYLSLDRVRELHCPILIIHGQQDHIVPFTHGEKLFAAAPEQSRSGVAKTFLRLPHAGHNDVEHVAHEEIHTAHRAFLQRIEAVERAKSVDKRE